MTASELIQELIVIIAEHGDLPISTGSSEAEFYAELAQVYTQGWVYGEFNEVKLGDKVISIQ